MLIGGKMRIKALFVTLLVLLSLCANASPVLKSKMGLSRNVQSLQQVTAHKTEVVINNNSTLAVWINVSGHPELLPSGFEISFYNDEQEISEIRIVISKNIFTDVIFDKMVRNHSKLWVKEYLPKN